jgi:hypothetical protein
MSNDQAAALLAKGSIDLNNPLPNKIHAPICCGGVTLALF